MQLIDIGQLLKNGARWRALVAVLRGNRQLQGRAQFRFRLSADFGVSLLGD